MKKQKWEIALDKFLKPWLAKKEVVGVIVCGSYITGNTTKHSDIDLHIILDKDVKWRERGNKIVDGILIEYFANPVNQHIKYFERDYKDRRKVDVHMFKTGKIIFDKKGDLKEIVKKAKEWDNKKFEKSNKISCELNKYSLWDMNDNLQEVYERKNSDFYYVYYNFLSNLLWNYCSYLGYGALPANKTLRFLTDKKDKLKYSIDNFPDKTFEKMFVKTLELKNKGEMMKQYTKLTNYTLSKMGGFNIDGWKIRSPAGVKK